MYLPNIMMEEACCLPGTRIQDMIEKLQSIYKACFTVNTAFAHVLQSSFLSCMVSVGIVTKWNTFHNGQDVAAVTLVRICSLSSNPSRSLIRELSYFIQISFLKEYHMLE